MNLRFLSSRVSRRTPKQAHYRPGWRKWTTSICMAAKREPAPRRTRSTAKTHVSPVTAPLCCLFCMARRARRGSPHRGARGSARGSMPYHVISRRFALRLVASRPESDRSPSYEYIEIHAAHPHTARTNTTTTYATRTYTTRFHTNYTYVFGGFLLPTFFT